MLLKNFYTLNKTLNETGCFLLAAQESSFLIYVPFSNTVSQDTFGTLPLTVQYLCGLLDAMPNHNVPLFSVKSTFSLSLWPHFC